MLKFTAYTGVALYNLQCVFTDIILLDLYTNPKMGLPPHLQMRKQAHRWKVTRLKLLSDIGVNRKSSPISSNFNALEDNVLEEGDIDFWHMCSRKE